MDKYVRATSNQLYELFEASEKAGSAGFFTRCEILVEYDRRGESHPRAGRGPYKYYREVAAGKLSPLLAQHYSADYALIDRLMNQSIETQDSFVRGETPIHVAKFDSAGNLKVETKPLARATPSERLIALTDSGALRPATKQKEILLERQRAGQKNRSSSMNIRVDTRNAELVVNQLRVKLTEVSSALVAAGYNPITKKK